MAFFHRTGKRIEDLPASDASAPCRLLAVRRAAWPLRHAVLRSPSFDRILLEVDAVEAKLESLSTCLADLIYECVPHADDRDVRRWLLGCRRAVHGWRDLPRAGSRPVLPPDRRFMRVSRGLARYERLLDRWSQLHDMDGETVCEELRQALAERTSRPEFRQALAASTSTLLRALQRMDRSRASGLTRDSRSLYSYVCRFASKANPLHVFSKLVPGEAMRSSIDNRESFDFCEVVFQIEPILEIEQRLLARSLDSSRVHLSLRPLIRRNGRWELWFKRDGKLCIGQLPDSPLLTVVHTLYSEAAAAGTPTLTRSKLERVLSEGGNSQLEIRSAIDSLIANDVLAPYLVDDLSAPADALEGHDPSFEPLVSCIRRWQLAQVDDSCLSELDRELEMLRQGEDGIDVSYRVNSYADDDVALARDVSESLSSTLKCLKGVLTLESNFSPQQRVIVAFMREVLGDGEVRPYLELLSAFLRRRVDILDRYGWGGRAIAYHAAVEHFRDRSGRIQAAELDHLSGAQAPPGPVCYVGPFDFERSRFFLSNVFAGQGVSVCRYLLRRKSAYQEPSDESREEVDVELAMPSNDCLNFVVPRYAVGFGFESRWSARYDSWLRPEDVAVGLQNGEPVYLHEASGKRLRFHHSGMLQAQYLPIEYQLLLAYHGANYRNPFAADLHADDTSAIRHQGEATFGPVCLRRERWYVHGGVLRGILERSSPVRAAIQLRRWVRGNIAGGDLWYFRFPRARGRAAKPRLLNLVCPMSVSAFAHALAREESDVELSRMEPAESGLWDVNGERHVAELMVEA